MTLYRYPRYCQKSMSCRTLHCVQIFLNLFSVQRYRPPMLSQRADYKDPLFSYSGSIPTHVMCDPIRLFPPVCLPTLIILLRPYVARTAFYVQHNDPRWPSGRKPSSLGSDVVNGKVRTFEILGHNDSSTGGYLEIRAEHQAGRKGDMQE